MRTVAVEAFTSTRFRQLAGWALSAEPSLEVIIRVTSQREKGRVALLVVGSTVGVPIYLQNRCIYTLYY